MIRSDGMPWAERLIAQLLCGRDEWVDAGVFDALADDFARLYRRGLDSRDQRWIDPRCVLRDGYRPKLGWTWCSTAGTVSCGGAQRHSLFEPTCRRKWG